MWHVSFWAEHLPSARYLSDGLPICSFTLRVAQADPGLCNGTDGADFGSRSRGQYSLRGQRWDASDTTTGLPMRCRDATAWLSYAAMECLACPDQQDRKQCLEARETTVYVHLPL